MILAVKSEIIEAVESQVNIDCRLVHAVPGRIRVRVLLLAQNQDYGEMLQKLIAAERGVTEVRINCITASIVICYNPIGKSDSGMRSHLVRLIQKTHPHPQPLSHRGRGEKKKTSNLKSQTLEKSDWSELKLPALATILALLGLRLPIPQSFIAGSVAAAAFPVAKRAGTSIVKERHLNIDCLDMMAIALSSWQGNLLTPALVMMLHEIGDIIRDRTARVSRDRAEDLLNSLAHYAWVEQPDGHQIRKC